MKTLKQLPIFCLFVFLFLSHVQCVTVANYDHYSYSKTIDAKVETLFIVAQSDSPYTDFENEIKLLKKQLRKSYEYDKRRTNNEITTKMWEALVVGDESVILSFFDLWKGTNQVSPAFSIEASSQIEEGFDLLLDFESAKDKDKGKQQGVTSKILSFITNL